jgi:hypothetical protein
VNRPLRIVAAIGVIALLGSCSATKLAYNRLDWLAAWEIGKYVDLDGPSKARFDEGIATLWQWHRSTQLSAYASDLRELADASQRPLTREQIGGYLQRATDHGARLLDEALPPMAGVLAALDDARVEELLKNMAEQRAEDNAEDAERTSKDYERMTTKSMRRWFGTLTDAQLAMVRDWAAARRDDPALWQRYGDQWGELFGSALAARAEPDFEARLRAVFREPQVPDRAAVRALSDFNRANYVDLLARLSPTLSDAQRRHVRKKLLSLAEEFEELAAQAQQAAGRGAGAGGIG